MSKKELLKAIREMEETIKEENKYSKRWVFLAATINRYRKLAGLKEDARYTW